MVNKLVIGLLVLLLVINTAIGTYAYLLGRDINTLSEQLADQQEEFAEKLSAVSDDVEAFTIETEGQFDAVAEEMQLNLDILDVLAEAVALAADRIAGLEAGMADISGEIGELGPLLYADTVYHAVSQSVVSISDGENIIGSGFIYDNDGHVVTANHVVDELTTIYVVLPDGRTTPASVVGTCPLSDVAVLTLERQFDVMPLTLADSAVISIGEPVVTIGSPFDEAGTITAGIVSQLNRYESIGDETESSWIANLIQFDAPANYGNSGGPLFNVDGEVVGIIIARVEPELGDGISYAVSSNKVSRVADAIIESGSFDYPWLGVVVSDVTPAMAEMIGRESVNGALVGQVISGGPAASSGVRNNDIVTAIDDVSVNSIADLVSYLGEYTSPGDSVTLTILRNSTEIELTVTLSNR